MEGNGTNTSRYSCFGGLGSIAMQFEKQNLSLRQIAETVGCSHETIRKELISYFGNASYNEILNRRSGDQAHNPTKILDVDAARSFLKEASLKAYQKGEKNLLSKILLQAKKAGINLLVVSKSEAPLKFMLGDGRTIKVKLATPDGTDREHLLGLHRFRLNRSISAYDFAIFAAADKRTQAIYIFRVREVSKIKSLVLRYRWLDRESKYSYARDRWSILLG